MAKFNEYPSKTTPKDADKFMLYSAEDSANKLIDYDKLADAVLNKLTSKQFTLDQGSKTLVQALNELNSNTMKHFSTNTSDITPLIDFAKRFDRELISFDAYNIPDFFPSSSNWWMGFIALNTNGTYGIMIAFSFIDNAIYKCCWNGSTDKNDWVKIS